jgi:GT2 family glycosyltransferase
MQFPRISVLLPTYRQPDILALTLRDLGAQDYPPGAWELVILDDGSKDESAKTALDATHEDITVTVKRQVLGGMYSHAVLFNELLRLANPESDVFIHVEDVRLRPDFLIQHAKWHCTEEAFVVTGPMCEGHIKTFEPSACSRWALMGMSGVSSRAYRCCFQAVFAKSMSYPRILLNKLKELGDPNPFDASMGGWGYHETEFAYRAELSGAICVYDVECAVYHPPHDAKTELEYRGVDRARAQSEGTAQNVEYLCRKHGLTTLPEWQIGKPLESPSIIHLKGS